MKEYIIYAGVNGAGKSTLYNFHQSTKNQTNARVNPDEIVQRIGSWKNEKDQMQAAKTAVRKIREYINQGVSFNQETTLAGKSIINNIKQAKSKGFKITMHYIGLESVDLAKERVKQRVSKGGHDIPEELIERRYKQSLENLTTVMPYCDEISVYDNSIILNPICIIKGKSLTWLSECEWFDLILKGYEIDQIKKNLVENGFKPTKILVNNMLQVNKEFNRFYTVRDIKQASKDMNTLDPQKRNILNDTVNDFIKAEKMQLRNIEFER